MHTPWIYLGLMAKLSIALQATGSLEVPKLSEADSSERAPHPGPSRFTPRHVSDQWGQPPPPHVAAQSDGPQRDASASRVRLMRRAPVAAGSDSDEGSASSLTTMGPSHSQSSRPKGKSRKGGGGSSREGSSRQPWPPSARSSGSVSSSKKGKYGSSTRSGTGTSSSRGGGYGPNPNRPGTGTSSSGQGAYGPNPDRPGSGVQLSRDVTTNILSRHAMNNVRAQPHIAHRERENVQFDAFYRNRKEQIRERNIDDVDQIDYRTVEHAKHQADTLWIDRNANNAPKTIPQAGRLSNVDQQKFNQAMTEHLHDEYKLGPKPRKRMDEIDREEAQFEEPSKQQWQGADSELKYQVKSHPSTWSKEEYGAANRHRSKPEQVLDQVDKGYVRPERMLEALPNEYLVNRRGRPHPWLPESRQSEVHSQWQQIPTHPSFWSEKRKVDSITWQDELAAAHIDREQSPPRREVLDEGF